MFKVSTNRGQRVQGYFLTVVIAMSLNILPLPLYLKNLNPDWVLLSLIYWTLAIPERIGVFNAWVVGLFVDVLTGRLLGMHGLTYPLISYTCLKLHRRLRQYPVLQQALFVFLCLLFSQMMVFWIESIQGAIEFSSEFWLPVLMGTLFWPFIYAILRFIRLFGQFG